MANATGTVTATSRQGAGSNETRTMTIRTDPNPPGILLTLNCSEEFFSDAKDYLGKKVDVNYDSPPAPEQYGSVTGLTGRA